jgi:hypothetical protein
MFDLFYGALLVPETEFYTPGCAVSSVMVGLFYGALLVLETEFYTPGCAVSSVMVDLFYGTFSESKRQKET